MTARDDEPSYFAYSATLRIHGTNLPFEEITDKLGVTPTHQHKVGQRPRPNARPYRDDAWHFTASVAEECELSEHLHSLWSVAQPNVGYLLALDARVDVHCGYRSNNGASGFLVEPGALKIFGALNGPFGVSVIIDSWLAQRLDEPTKH